MVEKCPQYSALPSPGLQYNACYKHVPLSLSTTPPAAHPSPLGSAPGIGLMTAPNAPRFGTVIPSRIFVGGIDFKTSEEDLQKFFSTFGAVRDTKIIRDRAEVSKGYGFVTFSSTDEVNKVMDQEDCLYLNGKKLNIGPAIRKQQIYLPKDIHVPGPVCSWVVHPGGYASYTNANGITYFLPTPQLMSTQQVMPSQQPYVMAYNGAAAPSINGLGQPMTQYAGFSQGTAGTIQPIHSNMTLPWSPTQAGSCGQILTSVPTLDHNQSISMIPLASANAATGNAAPTTRTQAPANQTTPVVAAPVPQAHIQIPTSYVCSPVPTAQQSAVPMRFAPHPATQVLHGVTTDQVQPVMHSVNYGQQMCNTPTLGSKPHSHITSGVGDMATITVADGNVMPAYGVQQAVYPTMGLVGPGDLGTPVHYAQLSTHQASDVLTPPPTPETQSQTK